MFGLGNTIGAGIYSLIGLGAKCAGPSLFISFIVSGLVSLQTAFVYAELSTRLLSSGSNYSYVYSTFGELLGWIIAMNMNCRYGITAAAMSRSWTSHLKGLLKIFDIKLYDWIYSY